MGGAVGVTQFVVMPEESMGKLSNSGFQRQQPGAEAIEVGAETLDHLVESGMVPEPDLIKIDVEGAEAMLLAGGERVLRKRRPQLFIEVHSPELARECDEMLSAYGYRVRVLQRDKAPELRTDPEVCHFFASATDLEIR
jgi:hypothetical protein